VQTLSRWRDRALVTTRAYPGFRAGLDAVGVALVGALALLAAGAGRRTGTDPWPFVALLAAVVGSIVMAAAVGARTHRAIVPLALAVGATWYAYRWRLDAPGGPMDGPFGYRNANGAFLAVAAVAWLMAGAALQRAVAVLLGVLVALALSAFAIRSAEAAAVVGLAFAALAIGLAGPRAARVAVALCGGALAVTLVATVWLGVTYDPATGATGVAARLAEAGLTERRLSLWHDAWEGMLAEPLGSGIDAFRLVSPTARSDADATRAHHEFLERGLELGVVGLAVTVILFGWTFVRLGGVPRPDAVTALGAAAVAVVGIHACTDYVLHTPAVTLHAAALFGAALVPRREGG
jgi:O-antigen ligase